MMAATEYRGVPRARYGAHELTYGVGQAVKEWATADTGATVVGVSVGIFAGEWLGSYLTDYFNVSDGWTKVLYKAVGKSVLSFVLYYLGRKTSGIMTVILNGASAGSLASIIGDVVGQYVAPGSLLGSTVGNVAIKSSANAGTSAPIGSRANVITHI